MRLVETRVEIKILSSHSLQHYDVMGLLIGTDYKEVRNREKTNEAGDETFVRTRFRLYISANLVEMGIPGGILGVISLTIYDKS